MTLIPNTAYTAKEIYDEVGEKLIIARVRNDDDHFYTCCIFHTTEDTLSFIYNAYKSGNTLHSLGLIAVVVEKKEKTFWNPAEYKLVSSSNTKTNKTFNMVFAQIKDDLYVGIRLGIDVRMLFKYYPTIQAVDISTTLLDIDVLGEVTKNISVLSYFIESIKEANTVREIPRVIPHSMQEDLKTCAFSGKMSQQNIKRVFGSV